MDNKEGKKRFQDIFICVNKIWLKIKDIIQDSILYMKN